MANYLYLIRLIRLFYLRLFTFCRIIEFLNASGRLPNRGLHAEDDNLQGGLLSRRSGPLDSHILSA